MLEGTGGWPLWRLRADAASRYLQQPFMPEKLGIDLILNYWHLALLCNKETDLVGQGIFSPEHRRSLTSQTLDHLAEVRQVGMKIRYNLEEVLRSLGPLTAI